MPRAYWLLFAGTLVNKTGGFVIPLLAFYLTSERHLSDAAAGLVMASWGAGTVVAGLVGGVLTDGIGRRRTMMVSLFGGAIAMAALGLAHRVAVVVPCAFALGLVGEMYRPAVAAMVADVVPPTELHRAYAHLYWAINVGFALAPTLAGLAAHLSYTLLFAVDAATSAAYGLIVLVRLAESRPIAAAEPEHGGPARGVAVAFADHTFLAIAALAFVFSFVMWQSNLALPLDMKTKGIDAAKFGALISINGVLIVFLQPPLARWLGRAGRTRVLVGASLLFGIGFGLHALVATPAGYASAIALWTFGEIAFMPASQTLVSDLAPVHLRGRYQGANSMILGMASMLGPAVGGFVMGGLGGGVLWGGCAALGLVTAVCHGLLGPGREREAERRLRVAREPRRAAL